MRERVVTKQFPSSTSPFPPCILAEGCMTLGYMNGVKDSHVRVGISCQSECILSPGALVFTKVWD